MNDEIVLKPCNKHIRLTSDPNGHCSLCREEMAGAFAAIYDAKAEHLNSKVKEMQK